MQRRRPSGPAPFSAASALTFALAAAFSACGSPASPGDTRSLSDDAQAAPSLGAPPVTFERIKIGSGDHLPVGSWGDFGPHCDVLAVPPALRAGRTTAAGLTDVREFIRDVTYSAYHWRRGDGAQIKFVRETASRLLPEGRPRTWMVLAGSAPTMFSGNVNGLNQNAYTQNLTFAPDGAYTKMAVAALDDALARGSSRRTATSC